MSQKRKHGEFFMKEETFQMAVRYGGIALVVSAILNIYLVMRNFEVHRDSLRSVAQAQQIGVRQQALQGVLQEFIARANRDPNIGEILKRAQAQAEIPASAPTK